MKSTCKKALYNIIITAIIILLTGMARADTNISRPSSELIISVDPNELKIFIDTCRIFAKNNGLFFDEHYLPFQSKPYTQILMSRKDGLLIIIENIHHQGEFSADFFSNSSSVGDITRKFSVAITDLLGNRAVGETRLR